MVFDREASLERLAERTAAAAAGAELVVFPEAYLPVYPSSVWAKFLAGWADRAKAAFARLAEQSVEVRAPPPTGSRRRRRTASGSSRG